jgi:hypothetical protein
MILIVSVEFLVAFIDHDMNSEGTDVVVDDDNIFDIKLLQYKL